MKDMMRYDLIVEEALRGAVRRVLEEVAKDGLPGEHHFYITFDTQYVGVELPDFLKERYPEEIRAWDRRGRYRRGRRGRRRTGRAAQRRQSGLSAGSRSRQESAGKTGGRSRGRREGVREKG
jgi:hypothetical protein